MSRQYFKKVPIGTFTQGGIFDGYVDENGVECFGLVVSARCDIDQEKVKNIVVLPVYDLNVWLNKVVVREINESVRRNLKKQIEVQLNQNGLPTNSLNVFGIDEVADRVSGKKAKKLVELLDIYKSMSVCGADVRIESQIWSNEVNNLLSGLFSGSRRGFYFLERVSDYLGCEGYVIDLTAPETIPIGLVKKISEGLEHSIFEKRFKRYRDCFSVDDAGMSCFLSQIDSPLIENIMQAFALFYMRVGLQDIDKEDLDRIKNQHV